MGRRSLSVLFIFGLVAVLAAQEEASPGIQAVTYAKVFAFVKTLRNRPSIGIAVVGQERGEGRMKAMVDAFRQEFETLSLTARFRVASGALATLDPSRTAICYVLPDADVPALSQFCAKNRLLTITGSLRLVQQGWVSLFVGTQDNKVKIVVNMTRLRLEGHELSAELLDLPRVTIIR